LYIGNASSPLVRKCDLASDGTLGTCTNAGVPDAVASGVEDIRIVGTTGYLLHYDEERISKCIVDTDGSFSSCDNVEATGFSEPESLAIRGSHMYVANWDMNSITRCIIGEDGSLTDCRDAGASGLVGPTQVAVKGSSIYITNSNGGAGVTRCTATDDGLLTGCTRVFSELKFLIGIAFS
jgi:hypothetical protein